MRLLIAINNFFINGHRRRLIGVDDERSDDEINGDEPETESIDDPSNELSFVRLVSRLVVRRHLVRHEPQLGED